MAIAKRNGKWWVDVRFPDGRRIRRVSPVQTKRGARALEAELIAGNGSSTLTSSSVEPEAQASSQAAKPAQSTPIPIKPRRSQPSITSFAKEWLETYVVVNNKASEVVAKENILRNHLIPFFDKQPLAEIGARQIEHYKAVKLRGEDGGRAYHPKSINNHLTVLSKLLSTAQEWEMIEQVPKVKRLRVPPVDFDWLTAHETKRFLVAVDDHYPQWRALFWLALRTGMRRGELFSLEWDDFDLVAGRVQVRKGVFCGKLQTPKNGKSRTLPLTSRLVGVVSAYQVEVHKRSSFLFPNAQGRLTTYQDHVDRPLKGALKKAGLRAIRFHDLRHSFASQLVSAGRSLKEVQELLGHQTIHMTMRYAHLAPDRMREAVEALEGLDE